MKKLILDLKDLFCEGLALESKNIDRLMGSLEKRNGIKKILLKEKEQSPPQLCVDYDEQIISKNEIKYIVTQTGKKLDETFGHLWIKVQEVRDKDHTQAMESLLKNSKGVMQVLVIPTGWIFLEFNTYITQESLLRELIEKINLAV